MVVPVPGYLPVIGARSPLQVGSRLEDYDNTADRQDQRSYSIILLQYKTENDRASNS